MLQKYNPDGIYQFFLFGSRAKGTDREGSDYDKGIIRNVPFPHQSKLKFLIEIDETPYRVNLIDFIRVSEGFRKVALQHTIQL